MKLQTGSPFVCADSYLYAQGSKIEAQVIFILLTLSIELSVYDNANFP